MSFRYCSNACNPVSLLETDKMKKEQLMKKLECPNKARLQQALADGKTCASQMIDITEESCRVNYAFLEQAHAHTCTRTHVYTRTFQFTYMHSR